jgi:hypothetical protein
MSTRRTTQTSRRRHRRPRLGTGRPRARVAGPFLPQISFEHLFPPTLQDAWANESAAVQQANIASAREAYIRRGLVLYLGAGVSCSVGLPTWWSLVQALTVTMMTEQVDSSLAELRKLTPERIAQAKLKIHQEVQDGAGADKSILNPGPLNQESLRRSPAVRSRAGAVSPVVPFVGTVS